MPKDSVNHQEEVDRAIAMAMQNDDLERQEARAISSGPKRRGCNPCSTLFNVILLGCVAVAVIIVLSMTFLGSPNPMVFFESQAGSAEGNAERWETTGNVGLDLIVENALDDVWTPYFTEYVQRWDDGNPDALTLTTQRVAIDNTCTATPGRLKVCNGDYGKTDWKGINLNLILGNYIVQGTSKMNDYFLANAAEDEKRYTMCHEMGHGFGLAHTDENYYNQNLRNCLDYTVHPSTNLDPGTMNFEILKDLYGTVPPARRLEDVVPAHIVSIYQSMVKKIEGPEHDCVGHICTEDLGDGYKLVGHKLLVAPQSN